MGRSSCGRAGPGSGAKRRHLAERPGPDAEHDTLILILATDPLFQAAALVDTQVYRTRNAPVLLVVPQGNEDAETVRGVDANAIIALPPARAHFCRSLTRPLAKCWRGR